MKWVMNTLNPDLAEAKYHIPVRLDQDRNEVWKGYRSWLETCIIGQPLATKHSTADELLTAGYVGVYLES